MAETDRLNQYLQILSETKDLHGDEITMYYQWNPEAKSVVDEFKSKKIAQRHGVSKREPNYARDYTQRLNNVAVELGLSEAVVAIDLATKDVAPEKLPEWFGAHPKAMEIMTKIREVVDKTPIES